MMKKRLLLSLIVSYVVCFTTCFALSEEARSKGFVYLSEVDHTIRISPRYYTSENFVGCQVDGYKKPVIIMTESAAKALSQVQQEVIKDGYCLVVYDAYRPQKAVNHFMRWSIDISDQSKKSHYYPRVDKARVFELGYVAERSGHSRGSTVDLTLIKIEDVLHSIQVKKRVLCDGFTIELLDDGTVDMGSSFDLFDTASHHENNLIEEQFKQLRNYLKDKMIKHGFKIYADEWWHFTLKNEPYPAAEDSSYFNFDVE